MRAVPHIDEPPEERELQRRCRLALGLAIAPWLLCATTVGVVIAGHRIFPSVVLVGWLLGFGTGLAGALLGTGIRDRRGSAASVLGFCAPLFTIVPTAIACFVGADWCC